MKSYPESVPMLSKYYSFRVRPPYLAWPMSICLLISAATACPGLAFQESPPVNPETVESAPANEPPAVDPSLNPAVPASTPTQEPDSTQTPDEPKKNTSDPQAVQAFRNILQKISENENQINTLYSTMPLGFPALQGKFMTKINQLKKQNIRIYRIR